MTSMRLGFILVLEAGLEPAQPRWPRDFKSLVSTIPPFEQPLSFLTEKHTCFPRLLQVFCNSGAKVILFFEKTTNLFNFL